MKLKVLFFTLITVLFLFILAYCSDGSLVTIGFFIFIIGTLGYICFKLNDIHKELRKLTDPNGEIEKAKKEKFFTTPEGEVLPSFLKKSEDQ